MANTHNLQSFNGPLGQGISTANQTSSFSTIRQGNLTNALTKITPKAGNTEIDIITGAATVKQGDFAITFDNLEGLQGLKQSTYRLLDAITVAHTEGNGQSPTVTISLEEYMNRCGLKDRKEAKKQANSDLETLFNARVTFKEKAKRGRKARPEEELGYMDMRICEMKGISRSGIISFGFGSTFFKMMNGLPVMPYPPQLWRLNSKTNPNAYFLLRKISELKNMNFGKKNEDTISVKTLLKVATALPSYEEVMSTDKAVNRRIIERFERDMSAFEDTLTWEYCHANGEPLTDQELASMDYALFVSLNVRTFWKNYPDRQPRLEGKSEEVKSKKKRTTPSKKKGSTGGE